MTLLAVLLGLFTLLSYGIDQLVDVIWEFWPVIIAILIITLVMGILGSIKLGGR